VAHDRFSFGTGAQRYEPQHARFFETFLANPNAFLAAKRLPISDVSDPAQCCVAENCQHLVKKAPFGTDPFTCPIVSVSNPPWAT
jgi:hypothetical protein